MALELGSATGTIIYIGDFDTGEESNFGCYKEIRLKQDNGEEVHFIVSTSTYILDHVNLQSGDTVTGYYNPNLPTPLIYPPRYQASILVKELPYENTYVGYFNTQLISSDGTLQIIPISKTVIELTNGMQFNGSLKNQYLIVTYGPSTRSIPAQTTPTRIIVLCR